MRNKDKRRFSQISNRIIIRFVASCLLWIIAVIGGFLLGWFICSRINWEYDSLLYLFLSFVQEYSLIIIVVAIFGGMFVFALISIKESLRYLNDMVEAAKNLSHPNDVPIELPAELTDVQNELNLAREQALRNIDTANDAVRRKNDLIMYLAHDLKTPLASVIGYLNLLRDEGQISEELREKYLSISLNKAERLEDLINEFFEIARFNLSTVTLQYSKINLTRLLEQLTYEFKPMLQEKNLSCKLGIYGDIMLRCDADKIQRVFDNLLRNAVIYSYENTEIEITAKNYGENITVTFANMGDTIPQEKLDRIFEQFYRLDAARSTSGGAGLGLAIAQQIAQLHGGKITAESERDRIEFEVTLPVM